MEAALRKIQDRIQENFQLKKVGGGAKFFGGSRRGEVVELAADINSTDKDRQKNAVKRIIANMTLGRDVSQLFVEVVKLGQTLNVELKKLVYLYVLNTAKLQPEKALMAVNTFLQDAAHASPIIRALAIRTMMCIRVECVTEYTLEPLRRSVVDVDPYVRKTAAIAIGKLFHQNSRLFLEQNFAAELVRLLSDPFPIVSSNAAMILAEVNAFSGTPLELKPEWVNQLLNALPECSEWGQGYVMELLAGYVPATAEQADTLLQRVVPRLAHTNPAVVMGAVKVIASQATRCSVDVAAIYVPRINAALLTLAKADPETQYVVCKNVQMLLVLFPTLLQNNVDCFYIRFTDPPYVKREKLRLILRLTTTQNASMVVKELAEYSNEVDIAFVKEVVAAIAAVAMKVDTAAQSCVSLLLEILRKRPEMLPQVVTASKNVVRKYPDLLMLDTLLRDHGADAVADEEAKVSLVWMLGEFCDFVESGTAVLKQFLDTLTSQEQSVQLALLTAVVKVFLRSPKSMEATLNHVLETLTTHSMEPDVRDRAYGYWRLLSKGVGVENMKKIVHGRKPPIEVDRTFSDAMTLPEMRVALNTAAAVFGQPYRTFLPPYGASDNANGDSDDEEDFEQGGGEQSSPSTPAQGSTATTNSSSANAVSAAPPTSAGKAQMPDIFGAADVPPPTKQPQQQPARHSDPLADLFAPSKPAPAAVSTAAQTPASTSVPAAATVPPRSPFDDIFGAPSFTPSGNASATASTPSAAATQATSSPSALPVLSGPANTSGLIYRAAVRTTPTARLSLSITNTSSTEVQSLALQVNKSAFGFVPSVPLASVLSAPSIAPGSSVTVELPLTVADTHFASARHTVDVAVKSSHGLHMFSVTLSVNEIMKASPPVLDRASFLQQWKSLDEACEAKALLPTCGGVMSRLPLAAIKSRLEECHCVVVADRSNDEQTSLYGGCRTHLGLSALFEIVLKKSAPDQSYLCCKSMRVNDVISSVSFLLHCAFPATVVQPTSGASTVVAAVKPNVLSTDDLFS